jgi:transcriptional regulator with XRE-family HTH domain
MPTPASSVSNRIAAWRKYRNHTQDSLASKLKVSLSTIQGWEAGRFHPNPTHIAMLSSALQCRPQDLFPG